MAHRWPWVRAQARARRQRRCRPRQGAHRALKCAKSNKALSIKCEGHHVLQGVRHVCTRPGCCAPHSKRPLHLRCRVFLAAAQRAGDDGKLPVLGPVRWVLLSHIGQRADDHVPPSSLHQLGRHGFELAAKNRLSKKVCKMSSRWWPRAILGGPLRWPRYREMPRRKRLHKLHRVLPAGFCFSRCCRCLGFL